MSYQLHKTKNKKCKQKKLQITLIVNLNFSYFQSIVVETDSFYLCFYFFLIQQNTISILLFNK